MNCANHPDRERVAFCQNCGKPLCSECTRTVGTAVFCEPCLAARLASADTANSSAGIPYGNVNVPYGAASSVPPVPGAPNPALAGLLGLIPGVGAMYNGQYAKGVVHLVIFAVLVSFTDNNGLFGLFVAGWVFYQVFEAYHTARARRDGTPLPNPFGLNEIGDKLGFGKAWSAAHTDTGVPSTPYAAAPPYAQPPVTRFTQGPAGQSFVGGDGSHFTQGAEGTQNYGAPGAYSNSGWGAPAGSYVPPMPPIAPYATEADLTPRGNRFPVGAILLIVFGILFFFGSSGWFHGFPVQRVIPFLIIATGIWIFFHKMSTSGLGVADDGSPGYRLRVIRALRGAIWVILVGVLFFLDTFNILSWDHSWPLFIIIAGLMTMLDRSAASALASQQMNYPNYPPTGSTPSASSQATPATTSIVPVISHDEEGR
jgi:hypothetical protein